MVLIRTLIKSIAAKVNRNEQLRQEKKAQAAREAEIRRIQPIADQINMLTEVYDTVVDPTAQETRAVWKRFCGLLETCGIQREYPVFRIYADVREFLENLCFYEDQNAYAALTKKLLRFYCRVASSFGLEEEDQIALLQYLMSTFDAEGGKELPVGQWGIFSLELSARDWREMCLELLEKSCERDCTWAICHLADCYRNKREPVLWEDDGKAFALYKQAAQLGEGYAAYMMGKCYEGGRGIRRNVQKAGDCYQYAYNLSGEEKYASALYRLYNGKKWDKRKYSPDIFICDDKPMEMPDIDTLMEQTVQCAKMNKEGMDPAIIATALRRILEAVVNDFVDYYESDCLSDSLIDKIRRLEETGRFTEEIAAKAHNVRKVGNRGAHADDVGGLTQEILWGVIRDAQQILEYYEQY